MIKALIAFEEQIFIPFKKQYDLTKTDILLLSLIEDLDSCNAYDLKKTKLIDPSLTVRRIRYLEGNSFLKRENDGRKKKITLLPKGKMILKTINDLNIL